MFDLLQDFSTSWLNGAVRSLESFRRSLTLPFPIHEDPSPTTPYTVIYEGGKLRLRHYQAVGKPQATPLLIVYALIKRPFILDLQPGNSVVENLTRQGFSVYLTDWIPPTASDTWRGFEAYVNGDLDKAVHVVREHAGVENISLLGYCLGGLLSTIYTALHPQVIKNLLTLSLPLDMSKQDIPFFTLIKKMEPGRLTCAFGNCPAWVIKAGFSSLSPIHHAFDKYVGLHRNKERMGYTEMFERFERWMNSDVPLAGQIFRELAYDIFQQNLVAQSRLQVGKQVVNLQQIKCPVLNILGEHDDVVHPQATLPLVDLVGSRDAQTLAFPAGHIGVVVSSGAQKKLWPKVGEWLRKHDRKRSRSQSAPVVRRRQLPEAVLH
jgi:polyhydroxyalkanoate synthase